MRAKVAKSAGGHALEERFLKLNELEVALLYMQAIKEENEADKKQFDLIKVINEAWSKKFENLFEMQQLFSNPELYKKKLEMKDMDKHREEINEHNFDKEWEKLMQVIPDTYIVDEGDKEEQLLAPSDPEFDMLVAGWVESGRQSTEE